MAETNKRPNWFERNPKSTIAVTVLFFLFFLLSLDLLIGQFYVDKFPYVRNSFYHHGLTPNWSGLLAFGNYVKPFYSNNLAFKDRTDRRIKLDDARYRILFMGDSFTEGVGMTYEETFVGLISQKLDRSKFDILNAAVVSYSPKLYYLKTKYLIENVGLKLDELVVCIDISDIQDEIVYEHFVPSDSCISFMFDRLLFFIRNNSMVYKGITEIQNQGNAVAGGSWQDKLDIGFQGLAQRPDFNKQRPEWTFDENIWRSWGEKGFHLATKNMDKLLKLCSEHQIKMTIVVYPWPSEFIHKNVDSRNVTLWKSYCKQHDINFINLYDSFDWSDKAADIIAQYYIPKDMHFNKNGHKLVANALLQNLPAPNIPEH
jgi:lysophospholipase L1-like esterase